MEKQMANAIRAALARAAEAVERAGGPQAVVEQVVAAVTSAAQHGYPTLPPPAQSASQVLPAAAPPSGSGGGQGRRLRGSLSTNIRQPSGQTQPPAAQPSSVGGPAAGHGHVSQPPGQVSQTAGQVMQPRGQSVGWDPLAAAAAQLNAAVNSGSVEAIMSALFAYESAETDAHAQQLLAQSVPPTAVARLIAEKKAQAAQENLTMISNIQGIQHQTTMGIINSMR